MSDDVQFPQTPWDRLKDRIRHWWHVRRLPKVAPPEQDPPVCPVVLDLFDALLDGDDMRGLD
jgi:hypothetical protein